MTVATSVANGLQAALLLARGRPEGLRYVSADMASAARSFWAAAICLPAFICLTLIGWKQSGLPSYPEHAFALDLLCYVIGWSGFALLSLPIADGLGRTSRWPIFIVVWNWCNVVQNLLCVMAGIPVLLGAPAWVCETSWLVAYGWALWLEWYAARLSLQVSSVAAAGLVALDVLLGLFLVGLSAAFMPG